MLWRKSTVPSTSNAASRLNANDLSTATIIDNESVKSAEKGGSASINIGSRAGKSIKGKKRHVLHVDTVGLLLHALVTSADVQDRDGGLVGSVSTLFARFPIFSKETVCRHRLRRAGIQDGVALAMPGLLTEIVRRCDQAKGIVSLALRWIGFERTITWLQPL